ncbi:MAG: hypothetical protein ACLQKA_13130 [Bryobacteraceae bacterium]
MHRSAPSATSLDERISEARSQLQRTPEWHPEFERRLFHLISLVDERDERAPAPRIRMAGQGCRHS